MNTAPGVSGSSVTTTPAPSKTGLSSASSGLYVGVALVSGIGLSGTRAAPVIAALLGVALIYQLNLLLQGK